MPVPALAPYDPSNIFARILRDEIPSRRVYEDDFAIAFHDLHPLAPVHILVIPSGPYVSWADFSATASDAEIAGFVRASGGAAPPRSPLRRAAAWGDAGGLTRCRPDDDKRLKHVNA